MATPARIGSYEVVRTIAQGGMGVVYEARDVRLERRVALKMVRAEHDPRLVARFEREARALAGLTHPGVVRIYEFGQDAAGRPYIAMELLPGETLESRLRRDGPLPPPAAARLGLELARALAHVHRLGILHRDLKPGNVLFDDADRPLLADFGLARALGDTRLSRTGDVLGTPEFMAPEQASGEATDARTDLYGLGAVLYAALTGSPPFQGPAPVNVLHAVLGRPPRPLRELRPEVPPGLEAVVLRCLEKDPARRFPDADALAAALEPHMRAAAAPGGSRRPAGWIAAGAGAAVLVGFLAGAAVRWGGLPEATPGSGPAGAAPPAPSHGPAASDGSERDPPSTVAELRWEQVASAGPAARFAVENGLAHDPREHVTYLYGGWGHAPDGARMAFADLWRWDGRRWEELPASGPGPGPRYSHSLAFDPTAGELLLYGGGAAQGVPAGDLWTWRPDRGWRELPAEADPVPPPARLWHGSTFLADKGALLVFGGGGAGGAHFGDTYTLRDARWRLHGFDGGQTRELAAVAYDRQRGRVVAFGGKAYINAGEPQPQVLDGTDHLWEWDVRLERWLPVARREPWPSPRTGAAMVWDGRRVLLFGGRAPDKGADLSDLWAWDGEAWSRLEVPGEVPPRHRHGMAWDGERRTLLVFGGSQRGDTRYLGDTWALRFPARPE